MKIQDLVLVDVDRGGERRRLTRLCTLRHGRLRERDEAQRALLETQANIRRRARKPVVVVLVGSDFADL